MATDHCAVQGCLDGAPATERLELQFRLTSAETVRVVVPLCAEHDRVLEEWKRRNVPLDETDGE